MREGQSKQRETSGGQGGSVYLVAMNDCSSSTKREIAPGQTRAEAVALGYQKAVQALYQLRRKQPMLQIKVRALAFADDCRWLGDWQEVGPHCPLLELKPSGTTQLGGAVRMAADEISGLIASDPQMLGAAMLLISDGEPTNAQGYACDQWRLDFQYLEASAAGAVALRAAVNVCGEGSNEVLEAFTRDSKMVLTANTAGEIQRKLEGLAVNMTQQASRGVTQADLDAVIRSQQSRPDAVAAISQGDWGQLQGKVATLNGHGCALPQVPPAPAAQSQRSVRPSAVAPTAPAASKGLRSMAPGAARASVAAGAQQQAAKPSQAKAGKPPLAGGASRGLRSLAPGGQTHWIDLSSK